MKSFILKNRKHFLVLMCSLYSLFLIIKIALEAISLSTALGDVYYPNIVDKISKGVSNHENIIEIAFLIVVLFAQGFFARSIYKNGNKNDRKFALSSFIVGGLFFITLFFFIMKLLNYENKSQKKSKNKSLKFSKYFLVPIPLVPIVGIISATNVDTMDEVINIESVNFATNKNHINLIENFSDGLDNHLLTEVLKDDQSLLKDFVVFNHFINVFQFTSLSLPSIWMGIKATEPMMNNSSAKPKDKIKREIEGGFSQWRINHIHEINSIYPFSNKATFGIYGEAISEELFPRGTSGRIKTGKSFDKNDVSYNFASEKRDYTNGWKTTKYAPDALQLRVISKKINVTDKQNANLIIADEIAHGPLATSDSGRYANELVSIKEATRAWAMEFDRFIKRMPQTVYDNSLIVVFADHGSHANQPFSELNFKTLNGRKPNGAFLIKYPYAHQNQSEFIDNRTIYAPYLRNIETNYLKNYLNPSYNQIENFIKKDPHFNEKTFPVFFHNGFSKFKFNNENKLKTIDYKITPSNTKEAYQYMQGLVWNV